MIRWFFIALFVLLLYYSAKAQNQQVIDSLKLVINQAEHDTSVCDAYIKWGEEVYLFNADTALILWRTAEQKALQNLDENGAPLLWAKLMGYRASALNNIGVIYYQLSDLNQAMEYYNRSYKINNELGDKAGIAESLNNIGTIYNQRGEITKGLESYLESLKIREEIGDEKEIATCLNNIGLIYKQQGDISKALEYVHKSLKIRERLGNKVLIAGSMNNIGLIYKQQGDTSGALKYFLESLKVEETIGNKRGMATSMNNIGFIYKEQGKIPKALEYLNNSLKIRKELGNKRGIAISLNNIGFTELGQGALRAAYKTGTEGLLVAKETGSPDLISANSELLYKVSKQQGEYDLALEMYELHIQMRDSIKNEETQKATIRQQTKYEFEKAQLVKEQEEKETARILAEETSRRDNLQYSVILLGLLVLGTLILGLGKLALPPRMAEGIIFFSFLILFEFLLVLADPYIEGWSGGAPGIKLLFNAGIAALIFPAHAFFESRLKGRLVKR